MDNPPPPGGPWSPPPRPAPPLNGSYRGSRNPLFSLALGAAVLSVFTLGIYRFWERTRIRQYIWNATAPEGDPFEYTGTGIEKLLGFLVALVILAVTLGALQLALFFVGLSVFSDPGEEGSFALGLILAQSSFLIVVPLSYFAGYRSRRYKLARTRWRGIRFGLDAGAAGYAWRGVLYLLLTICSAGLLWPLMTFRLEKYRADRMWYGDAQLHQGGTWTMLYGAFKHIGLAVLVSTVLGLMAAGTNSGFMTFVAFVVGLVWFMVGLVYYRVDSFRRLSAAKTLGADITFRCTLETGRVVRHLILGGLITGLLAGLVTGFYGSVVAGMGMINFGEMSAVAGTGVAQIVVSFVGLLVVIGIYGTLSLIFITQPIVADLVSATTVSAPSGLSHIRQRDRDSFADADGFADALDIGGAF